MKTNEVNWDAAAWSEDFRKASRQRDHDSLHALRAEVFQGTAAVVRARGYVVDGIAVSLDSEGHYVSRQQKSDIRVT